jgi:hypothetical protein
MSIEFQTHNCRGGWVDEIFMDGRRTRIRAWSHGVELGDHYQTVAGAKCAITRAHRVWLQERNEDHARSIARIWEAPK